ncbi:hypothetical protein LTR95_000752 [Oleoguttula sp. CCFEE 5521]
MNDQAPTETEAELAAFRQRWREEVTARNKKPEALLNKPTAQRRKASVHAPPTVPVPSNARRRDETHEVDFAPVAYHDLPDKEDRLKLGTEGQNHDRDANPAEPSSALEHFERAVERESSGMLGDSLKHYRQAFRIDAKVQDTYSKKHFPQPSSSKPKHSNPNPSNAAVTVPGTAHHSLHGSAALPQSLKQLVDSFATLAIEPAPPATDASPQEPSPLAELPEEILTQVLRELAVKDLASFARTAQVCKRLAYLVLTEESIWKRVTLGSEIGFEAMHYDFACDVEGFSIQANDSIARYLDFEDDLEVDEETPESPASLIHHHTSQLLHTTYNHSYRQLLRSRPRLRFNGCYISTVNYTRAGANSANSLSWGSTPVHVVTYFRYLRFFRDGTVISLLTTVEPADVVHHLTKENMHTHHSATSALPSAVMRDALRGRWRLSGPLSSMTDPSTGEAEVEGDIHIETQGVTPKYTYRMQLGLTHAGKSARNNKLVWKGFWSWNRLTDDWAEFGLRNDRAYWWSRVKSFEGE